MRGNLADGAEDGVDWPAVRAVYESGEGTLDEICRRFGVTRGRLARRKQAETWAPRRVGAAASRQQIINRMFRLLERQVRTEEERVTVNGDKEAAVLGKLASTLEKLIEIDNAEPKIARSRAGGRTENRAESRAENRAENNDMKELRHKLAQRIARLKRG